jgi:hypothetical protein
MVVDHFVLPRMFGISRPLIKVPKWRETSIGNWPAIVALGISVFFGAWATGIFPGENPNRYWGPGPLEAWAMAGALYVVFVAITRAAVPGAQALKGLLGYAKVVEDTPLPSSAVVDIATVAEGTARPPAPAMAGAAPDGS